MYKALTIILILSFSFISQANENIKDGMLYSAVVKEIEEKISDKRISVELNFNSPSKVKNVDNQFDRISAIKLEKLDPQYSSFRVNIRYDDNEAVTLSGKYISMINVPVASNYIKFNDIITSSDISFVKVRADRMKRGYAHEQSEILGMKAKKYIASGSMFKLTDLISPPAIKNGDPVNIIYSSGVINLKTSGNALSSGAIGDTIKVKNITSGAVLLGEIINSNTVKVGGNDE